MSKSACPKCGRHSFEMVERGDIKNLLVTALFIQCSSCGTVVGVMDYLDAATYLGPKIEALAQRLEKIEYLLHGLLKK